MKLGPSNVNTNTSIADSSLLNKDDETPHLWKLKSWNKALTLELDVLDKLLYKSTNQHGHAKYHRQARHLHSLLTKRYNVDSIAPVAANVSQQLCKLQKDLKRKRQASDKRNSRPNNNLPLVTDKNDDSEHFISFTSKVSENSLEFTSQTVPSKVTHGSYPPEDALPCVPCSDSSLEQRLNWLVQWHDLKLLQHEGPIASRIHSLTHNLCLPLARAFFIPRLTLILSTVARIKCLLHEIGRSLILFFLDFDLNTRDFLDDILSDHTFESCDWLIEEQYVISSNGDPKSSLVNALKKAFCNFSYGVDFTPYSDENNHWSVSSVESIMNPDKEAQEHTINTPILQQTNTANCEDLGESMVPSTKDVLLSKPAKQVYFTDVKNIDNLLDGVQDKNAFLLSTLRTWDEGALKKKRKDSTKKRGRTVSPLDDIFGSTIERKKKKDREEKKTRINHKKRDSSRSALDDIFDAL